VNKTIKSDLIEKGLIKSNPLVMVTTYTPHLITYDLKSILIKHWDKIKQNPNLNTLFPNAPILAYKRAKNIGDMVVNSKLPTVDSHIRETPPIETPTKLDEVTIGRDMNSSSVQLDDRDLELINILTELMNG
jgi:hypothetical protein